MKWLLCENNKTDSKYWQGRQCHEEVLVDDHTVKAVCWKCVARMVPIETPKPKSGYPRGWKFMGEFVDKDGNVFHKGVIQPELFGTKEPTPIKESKKKEKKTKVNSFDEKVMEELQKRLDKKKTGKRKTTVEISVSTEKIPTKKTKSTPLDADKWFAKEGEVTPKKETATKRTVTRKTTGTTSKAKPKKKTTKKTVTTKNKTVKKVVKKVAKKKTKK